jgi:prepilin-type N-terminal cleavage/methylation domain-containing protein
MFNIYRKIKKNGGLTLVELMVVISIFLVISGVAIFDYGGFRSTVSLQNITDDIALSIRKAQGFAIGARAISSTFYNSYGMHFSNSSTQSNLVASNKSFLMFWFPSSATPPRRYILGTGICGDNTNNKCLELFNITSADIIKKISINDNSFTLPADSYLDIIFTRPDPRASFCYRTNINAPCDPTVISNVSITISNGQSTNEKTKIISVQNTGQISIQ